MQELKLVYKELKNHPRFSLMYVLTMFLGLVGLMIISNFNDSFKIAIQARAKNLLTADLAIVARRPFTEQEGQAITSRVTSKADKSAQMLEMYHMARRVDGSKSRLVQIKAVSPSYPLYGAVTVAADQPPFSVIHEENSIVVDKDILHQFKLTLGDKLRIGVQDFVIKAVIDEDMSTSWRGISMAPKVYMSLNSVTSTELVGVGTVASHYEFFTFPGNFNEQRILEQKEEILKLLPDPGIRVMTPDKASEQVGRVMNYLSDFLGLVSLVALFLSIIGIIYMGQSYFFERLSQIGILRSLGMPDEKIRFVFQMKLFVLAIAAWIFALVFTFLAQDIIQGVLIKLDIPFDVKAMVSFATLIVTLSLVLTVSFIVGSVLTAKVFRIPTREIIFGQKYFKWSWETKDYLLFSPLLLILWGLAVWQSQSFQVGSVFIGTLVFTSFILLFGFLALIKILSKKLRDDLSKPSLSVSMAIRSVVRSPVNSAISMWAIGIGVMLLALISQIESGLQKELVDKETTRPSLFLFDIQPEQEEPLKEFAAANEIPMTNMVPMVRARILKVNDKPYVRDNKGDSSFTTREEQRESNFRNRGVNLTYENGINETASVIDGEAMPPVFNPDEQDIPYMAIETRYAKRMGFQIGDVITFDILGVEISAKIRQIRRIKWTSFQPNFFMVLQKGVIDDAPKSMLSTVQQMPESEILQVQDKLVEKFHNISMINVKELIDRILTIFASMSSSIKFMAFLCILVGIIVIMAINRNQLSKQYFEISIQKVLGLSWWQQLVTINLAFLITSLTSTLLGIGASIVAAKIFSNIFFDGAWNFNFLGNLYILAFIVTVSVVTVSVGSIGILRKKPKVFLS